MNTTNQVEIVEDKVAVAERQYIELNLADLDLIGGGSLIETFF